MQRFVYRVWDKKEKKMITGNEALEQLSVFVNNDRYVVMESIGYLDKQGVLIFEGDYIANVCHRVQGVCSYTIKQIVYDEENRRFGERYIKDRVVYHEEWQNDRHEDMIYSLSKVQYASQYEVIGNQYEHPECVEVFRPDVEKITRNTTFLDKNGNSIFEYHLLLLPNGNKRVVKYNDKYRDNPKKYFLKGYKNGFDTSYLKDVLTEEFAKQCEIVTHTFLDETKEKLASY